MDLKSKNVLLNGRKDLAKIADVGLSRIIQSTLGGAGSTPFGVGTFEYTAPEILLGRQCNEKVCISLVSVQSCVLLLCCTPYVARHVQPRHGL